MLFFVLPFTITGDTKFLTRVEIVSSRVNLRKAIFRPLKQGCGYSSSGRS